jgi:hypothetical protein
MFLPLFNKIEEGRDKDSFHVAIGRSALWFNTLQFGLMI